jgi:lysophospholipid acyltransferase (LPLAT)-like uncharacterized protein
MSITLKEPLRKTKVIFTWLNGSALSQFEYSSRKSLSAEAVEFSDSYLLEIVIKDLGFEYISRRDIRE